MKLTRFGFNLMVIVWLVPIVIIDLFSNAFTTGAESEVFFFKAIADGLLIAFAAFMVWGKADTATVKDAHAVVGDTTNDITSFAKVASWEYIYCGLLVVYALFTAFEMHAINRDSTGFVAFIALLWTVVSLGVAVFAAIQFYRLKSGMLVELKNQIIAK